MKKAYELSTLTGTQVLLLVASETGHVYTFATPKLQPLITKPEGKNLIQSCLNAPEVTPMPAPSQHHARNSGYTEPSVMYPNEQLREPAMEANVYDDDKKETKNAYPMGMDMNSPYSSASAYPSNLVPPYMPGMVGGSGLPRYMPQQYQQAPHSQYQTSSAVQGNYTQQSQSQGYPSSAAYAMHTGLPQWKQGGGMQSLPMNQMAPGQGSQNQSASLSGLIQASKQQNDHSNDHT